VVHARVRADLRTTPVTPASFHPFVNLSGLGSGLHTRVPVRMIADPGIDVVSVSPSRLPVVIEEVRTDHIPVQWRIIGAPPPGYSVGNISVDPSTVAVSGPKSAIGQIHDAKVYLDLSQARYTLDSFTKPSLENSQGVSVFGSNHIQLDPQLVHIVVPIVPLRAYKSVPILATVRGNPKPGFGVVSLTTDPLEATISGSPQSLAHFTSVTARPLNVSGRSSGTVRARVQLNLPKGASSHLRTVIVSARLAPVQSSSSLTLAVAPKGVAAGLSARVKPGSVLVTVVGPLPALRQAASRIKVNAGLTGYGAGTFQVAPIVSAPSNLHVEGIYPRAVTVVLSTS
jgi:YbbR domain-containing protein